ncbi:ABC transporter substrate-binding protein [Candidatus Symbiobacter mobilis]|uniref:ABC-type amino acid transporter subunit n=1 Tax=Candidatus Symbiobacter mobilis CR TaxID=946483 RepID=U5NAD3_9BURK|nr:ABC transporter substrate-binding protein [Candidatus Symbiobacter mobilis]AGX88511.1 ABC-type amino acid transporter subunit [Candidatus Symbiobacter mobilis CR]
MLLSLPRFALPLRPLLVGLCCALVASISLAQASPASRLDQIQNTRSLRVCIWPDYYGITYRNPRTQQLAGIDIDMARELARDLGVAVTFVDSSFAKLIDDLHADRCDVAMFAIGITPQRQAKLRFTRPHLASDIYAITTRINRRIQRWADIDQPGSIVAVAKGTLHEPIMKEKLRNAKLLVLDTPFAREHEVQAGRADVFMTDYPYSQRFLANADWARLVTPDSPYHITPYAYAVAPGDDVWLARVDQFVADAKKDGRLRAAAIRHRLEPILSP